LLKGDDIMAENNIKVFVFGVDEPVKFSG